MPWLTVRYHPFQDLYVAPFPHLGLLRRIMEGYRQILNELSGIDVLALLSSDKESEVKPFLCLFSVPS